MRISLILGILVTQFSWASDPIRPATDAEIGARDSKIQLSMNLEHVSIKGAKAIDKFYNEFFAHDFLPCIDRQSAQPMKFQAAKLKAIFSIDKSKSGKLDVISVAFQPIQHDDEAVSCLKDLLKQVGEAFDSSQERISGEMVFQYSRPLKFDSKETK